MAIAASSVTPTNSLEDFRIEFNNLVSDVTGITATNKFTENIIFEGATADAHETTLTVTDPTADRTITLPNETGTVFTSGGNIALGGSITKASDLTVDIEGDISLDANGGDIYLKDGGTIYGTLTNNGGNLTIKNSSAEVAAISIAGDEVITFADSLVLADDKYVKFGDDTNILMGYDETTTDSLKIAATEGAGLAITLMADEGDDAGDEWKLNIADGGTLTLGNDINSAGTYVTHLTITPNSTVASSTMAFAGSITAAGNTLATAADITALAIALG